MGNNLDSYGSGAISFSLFSFVWFRYGCKLSFYVFLSSLIYVKLQIPKTTGAGPNSRVYQIRLGYVESFNAVVVRRSYASLRFFGFVLVS